MAAMSDRRPDPRGVRVTLVAPVNDGPALVLEPAQLGAVTGARGADGAGGSVVADGEPVRAELAVIDGERAILRIDDQVEPVRVLLLPDRSSTTPGGGIRRQEVVVDGWRIEVDIEPAARAALRERASRGREEAAHSGPTEVRAIIPGAVVALSVAAGDAVAAGQQLLVVEAMKMQNELRAPRDGTVERVAVGPGSRIEVGDLLVVLS